MSEQNNSPLQFAIYKGMGRSGKWGAVQFQLQKGYRDGKKEKRGCIFMDICSPLGENKYDWDNKIKMAISPNEIGQILLSLATGSDCSFVHDPGAQTDREGEVRKYLNISSPEGTVKGIIISATQVSGEDKRTHTVPLLGGEVMTLKSLLQAAIVGSFAW